MSTLLLLSLAPPLFIDRQVHAGGRYMGKNDVYASTSFLVTSSSSSIGQVCVGDVALKSDSYAPNLDQTPTSTFKIGTSLVS